jgi:transposase
MTMFELVEAWTSYHKRSCGHRGSAGKKFKVRGYGTGRRLEREGYRHFIVNPLQSKPGNSGNDSGGSRFVHGQAWVQEKLERIQTLPPLSQSSKAQQMALLSVLNMVLKGQEQLHQLEKAIEEMAMMLPEVELLKTIPGVGNKLAAVLAAKIGDASQFETPKQLVAYARLDPSAHSSGKFTASRNRISKRGSKQLRRALYMAVQCGLRKGVNERLKAYYERKRKEASPTRLP